MPLYQFRCEGCGRKTEAFMKVNEACGDNKSWVCGEDQDTFMSMRDYDGDGFVNEGCGGNVYKMIVAPAYTPSLWGDETGKYGVNGYFSNALGKHLKGGRREERKIMEERGYIPESDMPQHYWAEQTEKRQREAAAKEKDVREIAALEASGMDKGEAIAQVFSAERALSGDLDKTWSDSKGQTDG